MALVIYNTLTRKKEIFKPLKGKKVRIFVCGPTVYDYCHIGHARGFIIFDSFVKYLRYLGYKVFYLQNITDIEDKIIARAKEKGVKPKDLALAFEKEFFKDLKLLGITACNKYARATDFIKEIISQVKRLEQKGYTYIIEGRGVYFDISKFKDYGKLARRDYFNAEDSVSRIDYSNEKRNRGDFCLWKFKEQEEEPSWESPWGPGRPGWHIEDTAIAEKFFGPQYEIHGGGLDLIFPHHEAEIAQMEAISGKKPFVKYWMHIGMLTVKGEKMAKSLGNFITIRDFLRRYSPQQLRFLIFKSHWHSPLDYSESGMLEVVASLDKIEQFLQRIKNLTKSKKEKIDRKEILKVEKLIKNFKDRFFQKLEYDFNTPEALAEIFDFIKNIYKFIEEKKISKKQAKQIYKLFTEINKIFGIIDFKKIDYKIPSFVKKLVKERERARKEKNWERADRLREEIERQGFILEDSKEGPLIRKVK